MSQNESKFRIVVVGLGLDRPRDGRNVAGRSLPLAQACTGLLSLFSFNIMHSKHSKAEIRLQLR